jgi:histone deacetylase 1/2
MDRCQIAAFLVTHGFASDATASYLFEHSLFANTGTMDHLTNDLNKLHMNEQYHGKDRVHIASRAGMRITHISQSFLPTSCSHPIHLKYVLHVPSVTRNLLSVIFFLDNNVLFDFNPQYFFVKDRDTREVLLRGESRGSLYNIDLSSVKQFFRSIKLSRDW